jgi:hypothetical protein
MFDRLGETERAEDCRRELPDYLIAASREKATPAGL